MEKVKYILLIIILLSTQALAVDLPQPLQWLDVETPNESYIQQNFENIEYTRKTLFDGTGELDILSIEVDSLFATDINATGTATIGGDVVVTGDIYTTAWTDYSATSTIVGWSSYTVKKVSYKRVGNLVFVFFLIVGNSNATNAGFTVPFTSLNEAYLSQLVCAFTHDNGVPTTTGGYAQISNNSNQVIVLKDMAGAGWTNSGVKIIQGQLWYIAE